ncbi:putative spermidine/putrescine transport system ATP-binding protein [Stella humosa]|uniref:Putative spermidine/putrescine transport system ATP-binding protein n=1 Tax=Stella humosa TaxID=94 RepID=A0A3N1KPT7_9PROT|nr:ABC transporter ATP-binding protein [Stella humosa]ROP83793.1 putative spermidine/putrescine transport system ATP-binding protein [Stella humosa]BBK32946.1 ABC transporter ATP-binding protein [Stella humosa]
MAQLDTLLALDGVVKTFGRHRAVDGVSLAVRRGEFLTLLGPSGCGKTTILRMVAGFEHPDSGTIAIEGKPIQGIPPYRRPIGLVFQNLALFPHLTVGENIAFGLRVRRQPADQIARSIDEALALVELSGYGERRVHELSGGQRQRVALARALVIRPAVMLLDEPLGALDLKLRRQLQLELKQIQQRTGTTFIFVTHDQEEAITMSDRIAVMNGGRVEQLDTADRVYNRPATEFVATFVGDTNLLTGRVTATSGPVATVAIPALGRDVPAPAEGTASGAGVRLSIRPENIRFADAASPWQMDARVLEVVYAGAAHRYTVEAGQTRLQVAAPASPGTAPLAIGHRVSLTWTPENAVLLPASAH